MAEPKGSTVGGINGPERRAERSVASRARTDVRAKEPSLGREAELSAQTMHRTSARLWSATADPEGSGLLERGREFEPSLRSDFEPFVLDTVIELARLAESVSERLRDHPDPQVRRSAAVLAARAHPVLVAFG